MYGWWFGLPSEEYLLCYTGMVLHSVIVLTKTACVARFLRCLDRKSITEGHCEPTRVFLEKENGFTEGLDDKKLLFEAYVDAMPLKWNVHFFPQR